MTKKHSKTMLELKNAMLNTDDSKKAYEDADVEWKLKELLANAREKANLKSSDIARIMNVSAANIHRIEKNPSHSSIQTISKYLNACNTKFDIILSA